MKLKLTLMAVVAMLALGYQAQASIGITTAFQRLNISLIVTTNTLGGHDSTNFQVFHYSVARAKISNREILDLMADWAGADRTTAPWNTAQLVQAWDWSRHVLVVDKTSTNVLFDCIGDYNAGNTHYFFLDNYDNDGALIEAGANATDAYNYTQFNNGHFEILDDNYFLDHTDLWGYGPDMDTYTHYAAGIFWHESYNFKTDEADEWLNGWGGPYFDSGGTLTGHINSTGHNL